MSRHNTFFVMRNLALVFFAFALTARAEESGSATNGQAIEIFKWINFVIVVALVVWASRRFLAPLFRKKADTISAAISRGAEAKAEADRLLREAEAKLARIDQEIATLRAAAQRDAAAEAERIASTTLQDIEKIGLAAKAEIEAAERAARMELKTITANLAMDGAESLLAKELTPQVQEQLVTSFVQNLEVQPN
jgi:F-type H+-transporting ATPase subunit b